MRRLSYINWSEVTKETIRRHIEVKERGSQKIEVAKDMDRIMNMIQVK